MTLSLNTYINNNFTGTYKAGSLNSCYGMSSFIMCKVAIPVGTTLSGLMRPPLLIMRLAQRA